MYRRTTGALLAVIALLVAIWVYGLIAGYIVFQHQGTHCEVLFTFHDKWIAYGITFPYIIHG